MASEFLDPTSNVNAVWSANAYTLIDDGTRQPSVPATDKIVADDNDDSEEQSYGMSDPAASYSEITSIVVWAYGEVSHPSLDNDLNCRIKVGGVYETAQSFGFTAAANLIWQSLTFNGSWTEAEVDNLEVSFITPTIDKDESIEIHSMYVDMTGTEISAGVTRKIKIAGTFQDKPIQTKVGGTFVDKPIKIKVGGIFQDA